MGITHLDTAASEAADVGHLRGRWTDLGSAGGSRTVGLHRIEVPSGYWSTPAHEHGREEEIIYVGAGRGLVWHDGATHEVGPGDAVLFLPGTGAHTFYSEDALDLFAFGLRCADESTAFPRHGFSLLGSRGVESGPGLVDGEAVQWLREAELGAPEMPETAGPRPQNIINLDALEAQSIVRPRVRRTRRNFGQALGSERSGLQHVEVTAGWEATPQHCHSVEEEIFVILAGDGVLILDDDETPVTSGSVVVRPAGTGVAHVFRAGPAGLIFLAYGARDPADLCYYPRSNKIAFGGVNLIARLERLDYWDGED